MSNKFKFFLSGLISAVLAMLIYSYLGPLIGGKDLQLNELISLQKEEIQIARDFLTKNGNLDENVNSVLSILDRMEETNNQMERMSSDLLSDQNSPKWTNESKPECVKLDESLEVSKYVTVSIIGERTNEKTGRKEYHIQANARHFWRPSSYSWISKENGETVRVTFLHKKDNEFCFKAIQVQ